MLRIHFINVGHGDCTLIEFPSGRITVVDINNSTVVDEKTKEELIESATSYDFYRNLGYTGTLLLAKSVTDFVEPVDAVDYIEEKVPNSSIFRFILTHPDMDHMTGLYKLKDNKKEIYNFWDTDNNKIVKSEDCKYKFDYRDWETYQEMRNSSSEPKVLKLLKGDQRDYFNDDKISILSPTQDIVDKANEKNLSNLLSYVLMIEYAGHKIILGGDADAEVWDQLAENDSELLENISILKAPHHGRNSGYSKNAMSKMKPDWTICSIGKKPAQDAHNKYRYYTNKKVLSTRFRGNIVAEISDDGVLKMYCQDNYNEDEELYKLES